MMTRTLRDTGCYVGMDLAFLPDEISARSLWAADAMALLVLKVDTEIIRLLGR